MAKIFVVIPTYNEADNIEKLLAQIFVLPIADLNVLVVDDNSPDGTAEIVKKLKQRHERLQLLSRPKKEGLGPAYIAGFKEVLRQGAEIVFEMDADFSHQSKYLPEFLEVIKESDLVLGSRYLAGGGVSNWGFFRQLISRFGNLYARLILGLPYTDLTGGFKCFRRKVLEKLDLNNLSSLGYNFQIEMTFLAHQAGFKIKEIPIVFVERASGESKFNLKIILESFWKVLLLRFKK